MKVAIYARESSDDTNKAPSIDNQIERGKDWAKENNHEVVFIFADNGYSGGNWKRPDWNKAIQHAKGKHYRILWTWNQDRIARDTEQFLYFYRNLEENGIKVHSETEGEINMEGVGGKAKHISLAMASELFRINTSDKVKKAYQSKLKKAKAKGEKVGWGRKPRKYPLEQIKSLRDQGKGYKSIAKEIGGVSHQTIRRLLQNTHQDSSIKKIENGGGL